jgi:hypothetical protein
VSEGRWVEARERVEKLRGLGIGLDWAEVEAMAGGVPPLGVTIAQYLLDKPESRLNPALRPYYEGGNGKPLAPYHFYKDFFMEGRPAFVPKRHMALLEVLELAPAAGAVPVLSHPGAYFQNTTPADLAALKERGLQGVEVYTSYHDAAQTALYAETAASLGLVLRPDPTTADCRTSSSAGARGSRWSRSRAGRPRWWLVAVRRLAAAACPRPDQGPDPRPSAWSPRRPPSFPPPGLRPPPTCGTG